MGGLRSQTGLHDAAWPLGFVANEPAGLKAQKRSNLPKVSPIFKPGHLSQSRAKRQANPFTRPVNLYFALEAAPEMTAGAEGP